MTRKLPVRAPIVSVYETVRFVVISFSAACRLGFGPPDDAAKDLDSDVDDARPIDVAPGACEPVSCAAANGSCDGETCVILATAETAVSCPANMPCRIECTGAGRPCRDGASCGAATTCELRCIGFRACQDGASCGTAASCSVTCDGEEACEAGITPGPATCTSHCCGLQACAGGVGSCTNDAVCL